MLGIRSYRRRSSVSMLAHASRIRFRCETNRLYETTPPSAISTMIARITQSTTMAVPSSPFWASLPARRVQLVHHPRHVLAEAPDRLQERVELGRPEPPRGREDPTAGDLEREAAVDRQQPRHHPGIDQVIRELPIAGLHVEGAVEIVRLELDVVQADVVGEEREQVLARERQRRTGRVDLGHGA